MGLVGGEYIKYHWCLMSGVNYPKTVYNKTMHNPYAY
jgi:hypothetical protein